MSWKDTFDISGIADLYPDLYYAPDRDPDIIAYEHCQYTYIWVDEMKQVIIDKDENYPTGRVFRGEIYENMILNDGTIIFFDRGDLNKTEQVAIDEAEKIGDISDDLCKSEFRDYKHVRDAINKFIANKILLGGK